MCSREIHDYFIMKKTRVSLSSGHVCFHCGPYHIRNEHQGSVW